MTSSFGPAVLLRIASLLLAISLPSYAGDEALVKSRARRLYDTYCTACHSTGWEGAPISETADWDPRIAKGMDTLFKNAFNGVNSMPPKGTCAECSAEDLRGIIELMIGK
jgi:cytochrome c5